MYAPKQVTLGAGGKRAVEHDAPRLRSLPPAFAPCPLPSRRTPYHRTVSPASAPCAQHPLPAPRLLTSASPSHPAPRLHALRYDYEPIQKNIPQKATPDPKGKRTVLARCALPLRDPLPPLPAPRLCSLRPALEPCASPSPHAPRLRAAPSLRALRPASAPCALPSCRAPRLRPLRPASAP